MKKVTWKTFNIIDFLQYKFKGERFAEYIKNSERGIAQHMIGFQVQNLDDVKLNLMHYITKAPTYIIINIIEKVPHFMMKMGTLLLRMMGNPK